MSEEKDEFLEERRQMLLDMLRSSGWAQVARVAVIKRCKAIQRKLAEGTRLDLEGLRDLQSQYKVLKLLVDDETAVKFFLGD